MIDEVDEGEASQAGLCFHQRNFTVVFPTLDFLINILFEKYVLLHKVERKKVKMKIKKRELKTIVLVP